MRQKAETWKGDREEGVRLLPNPQIPKTLH